MHVPHPLPSYSICIPNYNHAHYLRRKIPQCLAQTVMPVEILIVDDGSTDDSCEVVREFARQNPLIRLMVQPENRGVNTTIQTLLENAKGEFVAISSADDQLEPDFAENLLGILAKHPSAGFAFSDPAELIEATGARHQVPLHLSDQAIYFSPRDFVRLQARNYFSLPSHASMYRRQALLDLGGFNPDLQWYADWVAGYALAFLHGACYVPKVLAYFTIRDGSISGMGRVQAEPQKALLRIMLNSLRQVPYAPLRNDFRHSALLTEYRLRALREVWRTDASYITPKLVWRCVWREAWHRAMPYVPWSCRRGLRRLWGGMTRPKTAR